MKYGLTRKLNAYGIETGYGTVVVAMAGDYIKSQLWCQEGIDGVPEGIADLYQTFAWAWFALDRNGLLGKFGLEGPLSRDALDDMARKVTVYMESVEEDSLPLADSATGPTR